MSLLAENLGLAWRGRLIYLDGIAAAGSALVRIDEFRANYESASAWRNFWLDQA